MSACVAWLWLYVNVSRPFTAHIISEGKVDGGERASEDVGKSSLSPLRRLTKNAGALDDWILKRAHSECYQEQCRSHAAFDGAIATEFTGVLHNLPVRWCTSESTSRAVILNDNEGPFGSMVMVERL